MVRFVLLQLLLRLLEREPPPLPDGLLPLLLGVQTLDVEHEHLGAVTLLRVLKLAEISAQLPWNKNQFNITKTTYSLLVTSDTTLLPGLPHGGHGGVVDLHGLHLAPGDDPASGARHQEDLTINYVMCHYRTIKTAASHLLFLPWFDTDTCSPHLEAICIIDTLLQRLHFT